ncbi:glycosyltransferase family 2 protein [uncultured Helicobacter sp.]|uniref:glycosyltransferase family 2 protein n=1 Tax=uncultured Helicobacter sp. TaxID=175537 RepID=UPI00374E8EFA
MREVPTFSIIIPTYNVQSYIARALDSCINQTLGNIEILVVDDCGNDKSLEIAQEYAKRDCRIQILRNPHNLGTLASRLEGIRHAQGLYAIMLDADDYLIPNACETLYPYLAKNPDIIHFKAFYQGDKNASLLANITHKARYILPNQWSKAPLRDSQIAYNFFLKSKHFPKFTLWDKCYKASLLKEMLPYFGHIHTPLNKATDMVTFFVIANLAKHYISLKTQLYVYCLNHHSITHNPNAKAKRISDMQDVIYTIQTLSQNLKAPYAAIIAHTLSNHLRALIILESRFDSCVGTKGGAMQDYTQNLAHQQSPLSLWHKSSHKISRCRLRLPYLCACLDSLKFWNRSLTYVRIVAYILSFGKIKL